MRGSPPSRPVQHQSDLTAIDAAIAVAPKPFRLIFTILRETCMRVSEVLALGLNETVLCNCACSWGTIDSAEDVVAFAEPLSVA